MPASSGWILAVPLRHAPTGLGPVRADGRILTVGGLANDVHFDFIESRRLSGAGRDHHDRPQVDDTEPASQHALDNRFTTSSHIPRQQPPALPRYRASVPAIAVEQLGVVDDEPSSRHGTRSTTCRPLRSSRVAVPVRLRLWLTASHVDGQAYVCDLRGCATAFSRGARREGRWRG